MQNVSARLMTPIFILMKKWHVELLESSREILADNGKEGLGDICALLKSEAPQYDWVGFYWMNDAEQTLRLGAYSGASTEHVLIPYGKGICGQVALSGRALLVPNVHAEENYLACSTTTQSELVVPIFQNDRCIGQIDIDSHTLHAFTEEDQRFLEYLSGLVSEVMS